MSKKAKPRKAGNRAKGGRGRKAGNRYPCGKLKPQGPNQLMVERRKALCDDVTKASCPLDVAVGNGWITTAEYNAGQTYIATHRAAGLGSPGISTQADQSSPEPVDVRRVSWSEMSDAEIGRLWDRVMRDDGGLTSAERAERVMAEAMLKWKALNAAMTPEERAEVDLVCLRESWPQWILNRVAGRMDTAWERKYKLLVSGLRKMHLALVKPEAANDEDRFIPAPDVPANDPLPPLVERTVYVDEEGAPILEVERIRRRKRA